MASDGHCAHLVAVIDARTFLDDMGKKVKFPRALLAAAKKDERAHLTDLTVVEVLAEMIDTADVVAERYGLSRQYQDEYSLQSQQRIRAHLGA
jgi:acetyl-CoA acetyltransferase